MLTSQDALIFPGYGTNPPLKNRKRNPGVPPGGAYALARCSSPGTSGSTNPTTQFQAIGQQVPDGSCVWTVTALDFAGPPAGWAPTTAYTLTDRVTTNSKRPAKKFTGNFSQQTAKKKAPGPGPNTNPTSYTSIVGDISAQHPGPYTPAKLRRSWLAWCAAYWLANQWIPPNDYIGGAAAVQIINWLGNTKTPTPWDLYMAQCGMLLAWNLPYWAAFGIPSHQAVYASYHDWGSSLMDPDTPDQPYWPAPVLSAITAASPDAISATITDPTTDTTPRMLVPILACLYASPPFSGRCTTPMQHLFLVGSGWIYHSHSDPGNIWGSTVTCNSGHWGATNPPGIDTEVYLPSPIYKLKSGQVILVAARTLRENGNLSAWATHFATVT